MHQHTILKIVIKVVFVLLKLQQKMFPNLYILTAFPGFKFEKFLIFCTQ